METNMNNFPNKATHKRLLLDFNYVSGYLQFKFKNIALLILNNNNKSVNNVSFNKNDG